MKMDMQYHNQAQSSFDKIVKAFHDADLAKVSYRDKRNEYTTDKRYSEAFRREAIESLHSQTNEKLVSIRLNAETALSDLAEAVEKLAERLDLNDSRLTAAIALATAGGADRMSPPAQLAIVEPFSRNADVLNALGPVFEKAHMAAAKGAAEGYLENISRANSFLESVPDTLYRVTSDAETAFSAFALAGKQHAFAQQYGLTVDETPEAVQEYAVREAMGLLDK